MGQKVWSHRLDIALGGFGQGRKNLEVLFGTPALRQSRERDIDGSHCLDELVDGSLREKRSEGGGNLGLINSVSRKLFFQPRTHLTAESQSAAVDFGSDSST